MKHFVFAAAILFLLAPDPAAARGKATATGVPKALLTVGQSFVFDATAVTPGGDNLSWTETWTVNSVDPAGDARRIYLDIEKEGEGELPETTIELVLKGSALYDVYTLDRLRPPATLDVVTITTKHDPIVDFSKVGKKPVVVKRGPDPSRFVRYQLRDKVEVKPGVTLTNVIEAQHARGETDSTETWWFDSKRGLVAMQSRMPVIGGGTVFTWVLR